MISPRQRSGLDANSHKLVSESSLLPSFGPNINHSFYQGQQCGRVHYVDVMNINAVCSIKVYNNEVYFSEVYYITIAGQRNTVQCTVKHCNAMYYSTILCNTVTFSLAAECSYSSHAGGCSQAFQPNSGWSAAMNNDVQYSAVNCARVQ